MQQEKTLTSKPHNLIMEGRKNLSINGVTHVESFDEQTVVLQTTMGQLTVKGHNFHLDQLNIDTGDVGITGNIYGMMYTNEHTQGGFFSRIFK